jgi:hypothetical protein
MQWLAIRTTATKFEGKMVAAQEIERDSTRRLARIVTIFSIGLLATSAMIAVM